MNTIPRRGIDARRDDDCSVCGHPRRYHRPDCMTVFCACVLYVWTANQEEKE